MYQFEGRAYRHHGGLWIYCDYKSEYAGDKELLACQRLHLPPFTGGTNLLHKEILTRLAAACTEMSEDFTARLF